MSSSRRISYQLLESCRRQDFQGLLCGNGKEGMMPTSAYLFSICSNPKINVTETTSTDAFCDAVFLFGS
jgi:hypothetical protein